MSEGEQPTWQERYKTALRAETQEEAVAAFKVLVEYTRREEGGGEQSEEIVLRNLSVLAMHSDHDTEERVLQLYGTLPAPIFLSQPVIGKPRASEVS